MPIPGTTTEKEKKNSMEVSREFSIILENSAQYDSTTI
jgi:hypothetical protein